MEYNSKLLNVETSTSKHEQLMKELSMLSESDLMQMLNNLRNSNQ